MLAPLKVALVTSRQQQSGRLIGTYGEERERVPVSLSSPECVVKGAASDSA